MIQLSFWRTTACKSEDLARSGRVLVLITDVLRAVPEVPGEGKVGVVAAPRAGWIRVRMCSCGRNSAPAWKEGHYLRGHYLRGLPAGETLSDAFLLLTLTALHYHMPRWPLSPCSATGLNSTSTCMIGYRSQEVAARLLFLSRGAAESLSLRLLPAARSCSFMFL